MRLVEQYTCIEEIRERVERAYCVKLGKKDVPESMRDLCERWIATVTETARREGWLLSFRQLLDYRTARLPAQGDRFRFTGLPRTEMVQSSRCEFEYVRPTNQVLIVTSVTRVDGGDLVTLTPTDAVLCFMETGPEMIHATWTLKRRQGLPFHPDLERIDGTEERMASDAELRIAGLV